MMAEQQPTTVRGIILAAVWGKNGGILAVDIAGYDERRYRVVNDAVGRQLHSHIRRQVVARGRVAMRENHLSIYVSGFQIETSDSHHFESMGTNEG